MGNVRGGFIRAVTPLTRAVVSCSGAEVNFSKSQEEELLSWEALMKDRYLMSLQQEQSGNPERRVQETVQKYKT